MKLTKLRYISKLFKDKIGETTHFGKVDLQKYLLKNLNLLVDDYFTSNLSKKKMYYRNT